MPTWLPSVIWLALLILFAVVESATVAIVSIWFAAGALCALLSSFFTGSIWLQIGVFLVVSTLTLALFRPLAARYIIPKRVPTNADRVIGQEAEVIEIINNLKATGAVTVCGMTWTARSSNESVIPVGQTVQVDRIEGVKLFVTPVTVSSQATKQATKIQ